MRQAWDRLAQWIATRLPARVVYWATVRCGAHATVGRYARQEVPALTLADALQRWDRDRVRGAAP